MKLFIKRYTKIAFTWLRLHKFFNLFSSGNLYYLGKFSAWAAKNRKIEYNDFPSKWKYEKRYPLYQWVIEKEALSNTPIDYLEFGVSGGQSFRWFLEHLTHPDNRFFGFDTFSGLPEDWGPYKKGAFANDNKPPEVNDTRARFYQGLFQQTLPRFLAENPGERNRVIMIDADLYSAALFVLTTLAPSMKKGDIIFFDEFAVPKHEFKAFHDFTQAYYINLRLIAAANNYYFTAFRVE